MLASAGISHTSSISDTSSSVLPLPKTLLSLDRASCSQIVNNLPRLEDWKTTMSFSTKRKKEEAELHLLQVIPHYFFVLYNHIYYH